MAALNGISAVKRRRLGPWLLAASYLAGCGGAGNQAPRFLAINGEAVQRDLTGLQWVDAEFPFTPGESQVLTVEVFDPDGDDVRLWFPKAPPGLRFEPENRSGTWDVPEGLTALWWELAIIAEDDSAEASAASIELYFYAVNPWDEDEDEGG